MNGTGNITATLVDCSKHIVDSLLLSQNQRIILAVFNTLSMLVNVFTNSLVLYTLIKTKQITNITCKVIFIISVLDILQGMFNQNLYTTLFFENICIAGVLFISISIFFSHMSVYTIAVLGIDRYLRIKHPVKFKLFWTTKAIFTLMFIVTFVSLFQAVLPIIGFLLEMQYILMSIYYSVNGSLLVTIMLLQLLTICKSNAIYKDSTINAADKTNKVITRLCIRIMLLLCFFFVPYPVMFSLRSNIQSKLNDHRKSILEFSTSICVIFCFSNSFANALLFLMTNVKAKRIIKKMEHKEHERLL